MAQLSTLGHTTFMHLFESFIDWVDWSKVFEVFLGAVLAFIFAFFLQWWLVRRQERFQKALLEHQLDFLQKLEKAHAELLKSIAQAQLDQASKKHFFDSLTKR